MKKLRQIVTKAVIAKGKKRTEQKELLKPPNKPTNILGCWVINHQYQAKKHGKFVEVSGKFDVNVWYAFNNHSKTAVYTETISYKDRIKLKYRDEEVGDSNDVNVRVLQEPNCMEAKIVDGECIQAQVEREFLVEVIGETTVCIHVHPLDFEEDWSFEESTSSSSSSSSSSSTRPSSSLNFDSSSLESS